MPPETREILCDGCHRPLSMCDCADRREQEADHYGTFWDHCPGCDHMVRLVGRERCPYCGWSQDR